MVDWLACRLRHPRGETDLPLMSGERLLCALNSVAQPPACRTWKPPFLHRLQLRDANGRPWDLPDIPRSGGERQVSSGPDI